MNKLMRERYQFMWWLAMMAALPFLSARSQSPTPDQLNQIVRSQPSVDVSAPVKVTASFDPPVIRPGEKCFYRVTFDATEVSVKLPDKIPVPTPLNLQRSVSGQCTTAAGGILRLLSTFNFSAQANAPGSYTVPAFNSEVYGRPVTVPPAQLVVSSDASVTREPARQLFLTASTTNVFVGEPFNIRVRLPGTPASPVEGIAEMQINGQGFILEKNSARQSITSELQNGHPTSTYVYDVSVTPITAGLLPISAQGFSAGMQFSGPVTMTGQVSISGGLPKYVLLESEPVMVHVHPLPSENELPGFNGLIGNFTADAPTLVTNKLKVGEPVQLTMIIRGAQNLGRINPPSPPSAAGWQIYPAVRGAIFPGVGNKLPGASFKYTLIPLTDELHATPAIPFSCFDPVVGRYVNLAVTPLPVTVAQDSLMTNDLAAWMLMENSSGPEKKNGLSKLAPTPGRAGSFMPLQRRGVVPFFLLLPVAVFIGLSLWDRHRRFLERHPEIVRRRAARRALRRAMRKLEQTATSRDAEHFVEQAINALQIACAPHYPATPRAIVCSDVLLILTKPEREGKAGELVRRIFAEADAAAFSNRARKQSELLAEHFALKEVLTKLEARL